ncbi:hypothetical protein MKD52_08070 [Helicobacter sp. CaF467b]|nr:hypothetical protein [Helicobacter sp. CaF467b]MCI2236781.1 hypothetical protein [Helicobacter sp. CaF467b]
MILHKLIFPCFIILVWKFRFCVDVESLEEEREENRFSSKLSMYPLNAF